VTESLPDVVGRDPREFFAAPFDVFVAERIGCECVIEQRVSIGLRWDRSLRGGDIVTSSLVRELLGEVS
jgi:hypothetical protein